MNTYTDKVKHESINKLLSSLFEGCNEYANDDLGAFKSVIEPDIKGLNNFRNKLCFMGELTRNKDFTAIKNYIDMDLIPYVNRIGSIYGHVTYSYTTGTWGVRQSYLKDILKVLELTEIPYLYNKTGMIYDLKIKITEVKINGHELWLKLQPDNREVNSFDIYLTWDNLKNNDYKGLILD
jgi:hypothetical protein